MQFIKDSVAGRKPNVQNVGISYMYGGFWVPDTSHALGDDKEFHVGPHIADVVGSKAVANFEPRTDGSNGEPLM